MPTAEILSQGDEVITGQITDTNAAWLAERLTELGFGIGQHTTVGDVLPHIERAIREAIDRAELVICTGGLGPTDDDLTARAVAQVLAAPLALDAQALAHIQALYERYGRAMPKINEKQAWLPKGCIRLDNDWGTAPGFALRTPRGLAAFLPGVPREMKAMFEARVLPLLVGELQAASSRLLTLRTTGIGESDLQERIGRFEQPNVVLSTRTRLPENHLKLRFSPQVSAERAAQIARGLAAKVGSPVFCIEGLDPIAGDLEHVVVHHLIERGQTIATAESCTGGQLAAAFTRVPGSSAVFFEGLVCYSNAAKERLAGVPAALIREHGAVSAPVARALAHGARERAKSTFALSTTGVAGPGGGTPDKPVGTVFIALSTPAGEHVRRLRLGGDRHRIQALSTGAALDLLRRHLQGVLTPP
ncbi:MAG: competence/damage-inducible protein A [Deltaproteobacteria bacterium]|nr:MAG: competence/damage-inducible protein A [Deltaproteobacteria bacterium]